MNLCLVFLYRSFVAHQHRRMTLLSALLFAGVLVCGLDTVYGCTCIPFPLHRQSAYCQNDCVFIGKVKKVIPPSTNSFDEDFVYRVRVKRRFRGSAKGLITVTTPNNDGLCGITGLQQGQEYLFTARRQQEKDKNGKATYRISLCQSLILLKASVTKDFKKKYLSKRQSSFPGKKEQNCQCKIQYCGENNNCGIVPPGPKTCTFFGDQAKINCYNKIRCIPSKNGNSCRWSAQNCGGPGGITIG
ncbi:uncharacterized protein [Argopecten irradians]|uniref:uncharacterized protein n=1 Tax=Argopecten irradians TaxID=31199 RepID=UPI00371D4D4F